MYEGNDNNLDATPSGRKQQPDLPDRRGNP